MRFSTKGEYALIIMLHLAKYYDEDKFISLNDIANSNNLSLKYLEKIMSSLKKYDFFVTERGITGGYKLKRKPEEYSIYEVLSASEEKITHVKCIEGNCDKGFCNSFKVWKELYKVESEFLKNKTLKDFI